jgi:hypothetical protein
MTLRNDPPRGPDVVVQRDVAVAVVEPAMDAGARALRWGPIVAGLVTALGVFILLSLLAVGLGLGAAQGENPTMVATIVGSIIALVSFFLGGFVAAWSDNAIDNRRGALDGFLVWALWLLVVLFAGALGLGVGALFGGDIGGLFPTDQAPDLNVLRSGALRTFLALALTAAAGALGGVVGTRDRIRTRLGAY